MKIDTLTFLYLNLGDGRATIAIMPNEDDTVEVGVAFCSPQDNFNRKTGRAIALQRLQNKNGFYVSFERDYTKALKQHAKEVVKFIIRGHWVTVLDFNIEINTTIYELVTETGNDVNIEDLDIPITMYTSTTPHWAKDAVLGHDFY